MPIAHLASRGIVKISGDDALTFLQGLITNDVTHLDEGVMRYASLLTPQGKILFDFLLLRQTDGLFVDLAAGLVPDFLKRLGFYRLRAKVTFEAMPELHVFTCWGMEASVGTPDPRHRNLGSRLIAQQHNSDCSEADYHAHRIRCGVPEGGVDFAYGETFSHEANMDVLNGLDFKKGCYVGQEVVSRMQHRGTARTRIVSFAYDGAAPESGASITAGDMVIGTFGSAAAGIGLAKVRVDRLEDAKDPLVCSGVGLRAVS